MVLFEHGSELLDASDVAVDCNMSGNYVNYLLPFGVLLLLFRCNLCEEHRILPCFLAEMID